MYLKSIRANGFKSFADKIELDLKQGITGVVGPNGSGKSNIVDAVRWVLGEQSVKALRGAISMTDVIFAGSASRKATNRAWVSLTFDNSDRYLNSEFSEIEIKRIVYTSGENEYYINNSKVRLKDITDLFLDSGAGKESFNIISQGAVMDIVNSKPEDRRVIFEEAAGVLKYKKRKDESFRKLQKTNENLARVDLLIDELMTSLEPLKEQSEIAKKYLSYREDLDNIEIALIAFDIEKINSEYTLVKENIARLTQEIESIDTSSLQDYSKVDLLKLESLKLDNDIEEKNKLLLNAINKLSDLQSKKQITVERKKYEVDDTKLQNNIIALKEEILSLNNQIESTNKDINNVQKELETKKLQSIEYSKVIQEINIEKNNKNNTYNNLNKDIMSLNNRIEILNDNIKSDSKTPYAVKNILNNFRLKGIHGTLGKLIEVAEKFSIAIETVLGTSLNVIIVDDEQSAKSAIEYLKDNKLGRATFYPLTTIKARYLEQSTIELIAKERGFIGIAAELIKYDSKYKDIIYNQLGNVIVVDNIDSVNKIGRLVNYKYRIVSLDGEILFAGGAIAGGTNKNNNSLLNQKNELDKLKGELNTKRTEVASLEFVIKDINNKYNKALNDYETNERNCILLNEKLNGIKRNLEVLNNNLSQKNNELSGTENVTNNSLDKELDEILSSYYEAEKEHNNLEKELNKLKGKRTEINVEIADLEKTYREVNSKYNQKQNELKNEEIKAGKMDVKLDNLLLTLNENYSLTYEKAAAEYELDIEPETARINVNNLKVKIKELGDVNTGSIAEYERVNERYEFLSTQKKDLEISVTNLIKVIEEMDEIMKTKFVETFDKISTEFKAVFKKLFKGGEGILELTNPNDILNTGIEIAALPPGKKLKSIALLSGGEKTLTAIALLFAILNVKPVPFVILDEVEAALDEANVDAFGNYLQTRKERSQFIIITHKKRTMEYADALYGVTMQESGVSKLVSVKLEN